MEACPSREKSRSPKAVEGRYFGYLFVIFLVVWVLSSGNFQFVFLLRLIATKLVLSERLSSGGGHPSVAESSRDTFENTF